MPGISREEVAYIAQLARLVLSDDEQERMTRDLGEILAYAKKLEEIDTTAIEPTAHVLPLATPLRVDAVADVMDAELAVGNAPAREATAFVVPKVIGGEDEG